MDKEFWKNKLQELKNNKELPKNYGIRIATLYLFFVLLQVFGAGYIELWGLVHSFIPFILCSLLINATAYFAADERQFAKILGGLMFCFLSVNLIEFLVDNTITYTVNEYFICFCSGIACTLLLLTMLLNRCVFINAVLYIIWFSMLLPVAVLWGYYIATGHWYTAENYWTFKHSTVAMALEYLSSMRWYAIPLIVLLCSLLIRFMWHGAKLKMRSVNFKQFIAVFLLLGCAVLMFQQHRDNHVMEIHYIARDVLSQRYGQ